MVGGIADVLLKDGETGTLGWWVQADAVAGRASMLVAPPAGGVTELDQHMHEIGHSLQSVQSGTNVLCRCVLHFN